VVQKILGHSNPRTTLQYYSQAAPYHHKQVAQAVDKRHFGTIRKGKKKGKKSVSGTYEPNLGGSERGK
jgi:integrase